MKTFEKQGMITPHMRQVCNGILGAIHSLTTSVEDFYNGPNTLKFRCEYGIKLLQNYASCCETCFSLIENAL
jgi:hypothetical protein